MQKIYRTEAIVLGRTKLKETDLILTLLAQDGSKFQLVAKGARRPKSKFAGMVQLFSQVDVLCVRGKGLDILSECSLVAAQKSSRRRLGLSLDAMATASAIAEVARSCSFEDTTDPFLFLLLTRCLDACCEAQDRTQLDLIASAYVFKLFAHSGWVPHLDSCILCDDEQVAYFSAQAGGVLCAHCAPEAQNPSPITSQERLLIQRLVMSTFDEILQFELDPRLAIDMSVFAHQWASVHMDIRLRAWEFLNSGC